MLNLNDKKTRNYKILVASATHVLNREYVITNFTHIIENSVLYYTTQAVLVVTNSSYVEIEFQLTS